MLGEAGETVCCTDRGARADAHERFELLMRYYPVHLDPARAAETARIAAALDGGLKTAAPQA